MIVHRNLPAYEARSSIRTWVYGICVRTASDYRRRAHRRHEVASENPPVDPVPPDQATSAEQRQARALLDAALAELDEEKRAVFVLYEIEELTMNEVAESMGCPVQTAYSRLHAARRQIRDALRARGIDGGKG